LQIAIDDLLLINAIEFHVLPEHEQQFLPPVPLQTLGDILGSSLYSRFHQSG